MPVHPEPAAESTPKGSESAVPGLLARLARGDESAWRALIEMYGRRVFAMARSRCRRDDLAEEIAQSVFVTIASTFAQGGYTEQGRFESWLFRVTMNRVRDEVRRERRHAKPTDPAEFASRTASSARAGADAQDLAALRDAVESLAEADREIVELRHHGGLSFKQIAETLGEPLGTVLARHHRALRKIKEWIEGMSGAGRTKGEHA
jgi:RNA polymerase sigma-70 factor (ECF subfamily)